MKKIILSVFAVCMSLLAVLAMDFSFSDQGFGVDANISRVGDDIRMQYKMDGFASLKDNPRVSQEQKDALANISAMNIDMLASCSEPKMKFYNIEYFDLRGQLVMKTGEMDWMPITKQEDIEKLRKMCASYRD